MNEYNAYQNKKNVNAKQTTLKKKKLFETDQLKQNQQPLLKINNKRSWVQNKQLCTELTLDGEQRGIRRNHALEKS